MTKTDSVGLYLNREQAEEILRERLLKAGIPLDSKTAKCMFVKTLDSHTSTAANSAIRHSEAARFACATDCDSGQDHQRAGRCIQRPLLSYAEIIDVWD